MAAGRPHRNSDSVDSCACRTCNIPIVISIENIQQHPARYNSRPGSNTPFLFLYFSVSNGNVLLGTNGSGWLTWDELLGRKLCPVPGDI